MIIEGTRTWEAENEEMLEVILQERDCRGGAQFWLSDKNNNPFPCLTIRVSGTLCDVHFFPYDGHPGYWCLGGVGLPKDGMTIFVFEGCDPYIGEETPNENVLQNTAVIRIAKEFYRTGTMDATFPWFEL